MEFRLRLNVARLKFFKICTNPNVSIGVVDCSRYSRRIALKDDSHKKIELGISDIWRF